jgi:chemotaxis protein MotA
MLLIIGLIIVFGAVIGGFMMAGGELLVLMQPSEFVVIGGAALGSLVVSTPFKVLKLGMSQVKGILGGSTPASEYASLLAMLYQVFKQYSRPA